MGTLNDMEKATPATNTRGIVLLISDLLSIADWPARAKEAGLTTIATHFITQSRFEHHKMSHLVDFIASKEGQHFQKNCLDLGIQIEHETHAMSDLLPRSHFKGAPDMFRMDKEGRRNPDFNFCAHSEAALSIICENAVSYAQDLMPTTRRYFFWIDDGCPMCHCRQCRIYSDSDQALMLENTMAQALRRHVDPAATLAHLAYLNTLPPPTQVKPDPGVFLEFAPFRRSWSHPLSQREARREQGLLTHGQHLELLDANLQLFGKESAQVLEYWLDVSLFSGHKQPPRKLPWNKEIFRDDVKTYHDHGVRHITSFGAFMDAQYIQLHGEPPLREYGAGLLAL